MENGTCEEWKNIFSRVDHYFRDEMVLDGTEYAPRPLGYAILLAYMVVIIVGAIGNAMTIFVIATKPAMRTGRNLFILNLAISDFIVCILTAPMTLFTVWYMFWPFGTAMCKIAGSLQGFNIFLSTFSIAAIALDRYILIIFPTTRLQRLSAIFFLSIWIFSLSLAIPLLLASDLNEIYRDEACGIILQLCHEQNEIWQKMIISKRTYTISVLFTQYALPLAAIAFAYSRIAKRMKHRFANRTALQVDTQESKQRRRSVVERQRRTHFLLFGVVAVFAVAWLPLNVFHIVNTFEFVQNFSVTTFSICHIVAMCSACLNPLIYAFGNQNFKTEFMYLFDRIGLRSVRVSIFGELPTKKGTTLQTEYKRTNYRAANCNESFIKHEDIHCQHDEQL